MSKKENAILITMGLGLVCLFILALFPPQSADAALSIQRQAQNIIIIA
jgi:hypothetical protein